MLETAGQTPSYNEAVRRVGVPPRIAALPISPSGYPIPFFVHKSPLDFRVISPDAMAACHGRGRCWVCGQPRGRMLCFVIGPMCAINRISAEPPSHLDCAEWSARACPFLSQPKMRRNDKNVPENGIVAGDMIDRNPGVTLLWVTRSYKAIRAPDNRGGQGVLFKVGDPERVLWFREGRAATRGEAQESINSGLPLLRAHCDRELTRANQAEAHRELERGIARAMPLLPAAA